MNDPVLPEKRRVAIVTGVAQGIRRAIAFRLARGGFAVVLDDINPAGLAEVKDEIEQIGREALALAVDLMEIGEVRRLLSEVTNWGTLTVLVNNVGRVTTCLFLKVTEAAWDTTLQIDLKTVFFAMQIAARSGRPDQTAYAAAKAGVISLTRSAALALAGQSISVNAVCPGVMDTPLTRRIHETRAQVMGITLEESLGRMIARVPLGGLESPDDVAGAVSFLCSPDAAYIAGQALNLCGGMEMD
ncbi:MAG: 3-oxoacyl-[acyl-carrier-protein] reductase [Anaerolineales bacterium]